MIKILVPTDYSDCSIAALKHAASLARASGGLLIILHAIQLDSPYLWPDVSEEHSPLHQDYELALQQLLQQTPSLNYEERRVEGEPVPMILSTAEQEKVDLIVMGASGRTGLMRILLGSVAEQIVREARCPVLTLKLPQDGSREVTSEMQPVGWSTINDLPIVEPEVTGEEAAADPERNPTLALISRAVKARASDIHIDPVGDLFTIRFRVDGEMHPYCRLSSEVGRALTTQLKVFSNLNIADPFHSQEGRLQLPESFGDFEVRITAVPVIDGEAVSLRILNRNRLMRPLEELGLSPDSMDRINRILRQGEGLVLVTGPTGSGKTTTLYSLLHSLDDGSRNIVSIEDPVEFNIPSFRQISVDARHDVTMNSGLKTLLRLDPDVVFVGEIRDAEAAETAMRAASSGKHVFSSLHTRDVASTVTALRDLRIDNRSLAANLTGIVSQRLIRRLCQECLRKVPVTQSQSEAFARLELPIPTEVCQPVGCPRCRGTGFFDRIGLFEVVAFEPEIMRAVEYGEPEDSVRELIRKHSISNLEAEAMKCVALGITSYDEAGAMRWHASDQQSTVETSLSECR